MTNPSNSAVQNLLPVQAYFNLDGSFNTFIGQGVPFYATANPIQSGLTITSSTINSSPIGGTSPSTGVFTNIATTTGTISTQPSGATDIVNLLALQSYITGISWKQPCAVATLTNITLSGLQTIDSYTTLAGDRVLVKNQSTAANNGIYIAASGAWTRATDADTWNELICAISFIEYGTQAGGAWFCTAQPGGTLGVTAVNWSQFTTSATYTAGTGLTLTGTQFSITPVGTASTYGSATQTPVFTTNASGQVTAVTNTTITPAVGSITGFGTGVATALGVNVGTAGAFVVNGGALGTPSSGTVTNLTGTASININGTVGATTASSGAFTVLSTSSTTSTTPTLGFNASNAPIAMGATIAGSYLQAMLQNKSGTAGASANYVLSNDLGTDSTYYGEFGMNSSVFSASTPADFFSINNGIYFSGRDGDVSVGSGNGYKHYFVWGSTGQSAHVINATGALGFSTNLGTTPALSGTTGFGTAGQVLSSNGSASAPTWVNPSSLATAAGGSNTQVQYNSSGSLAGSANMTFSGSNLTLAYDAYINSITIGKGAGAVTSNLAVGINALGSNSSGSGLTAIGYNALQAETTAVNNTVVGTNAGYSTTTGSYNSVLGQGALFTNTTGGSNVALGAGSLFSNTTASNNTAVGYQAGYINSTGTNLTAVGYQALYNSTLGYNTAFGYSAGSGISTGQDNTAIGRNTMVATCTGGSNTTVGENGLYANTTGSLNCAFGTNSLQANTTGTYNVAYGASSLFNNTTASNNTAVGYQAGYANQTGTRNVYVGYTAGLNQSAGYNTAVGAYSLQGSGAGTYNSAFGDSALYSNTSGNYNTALGQAALTSNTTASNNTAVGYQAGYSNLIGARLTALGVYAGYSNTADNNTFVGGFSGYATTSGTENSAYGDTSLRLNTTGSYNVALGKSALFSNTTASNNTAVGYQAGYSGTTAAYNTFLGYQSGYTSSTNGYMTCVGALAGTSATATYSTFVGAYAGQVCTGVGNTFVGTYYANGAGSAVTSGTLNTILGGYTGNQGGLDIRTASNYIVLSDGAGNPRGVFDGSGNFLVGTTTSSGKTTVDAGSSTGLFVKNTGGTTYTPLYLWNATTTGDGYFAVFSTEASATLRGTITYNRGAGLVAYNVTSDYRAKTIDSSIENALDDVNLIKTHKATMNGAEVSMPMFVAHELAEIAPYCVTGEKDAVNEDGTPKYQQVDSSPLIPLLVKAIQELNAKVEAQALEIANLKGK